ncbi:MAG: DNA-3-methyladenine glycosylase I [Alphaproteobacteria bacterium]|nr:DNA-3-methyladenine glycosylase I [Alphaproteobacteria bacterium]
MVGFAAVEREAARRQGGTEALAALLPEPRSAAELTALTDGYFLSQMCLRIFRAGLKHAVVDAKWPGFEEVFLAFEPARVSAISDESLERMLNDKRVIRHWGKIKAVRENAAAMCELVERHGRFGVYLADWPAERIVDLWDEIAKRFTQMGGNSTPYFLRMIGKDTFILTDAVVQALNHWRAHEGTPKAKGERRRVQQVFNAWASETGRPLCQLSRILALSVD